MGTLTELLFTWQGAVALEFLVTWAAIYFFFMRRRRAGPPGKNSRYYNRYSSRFRGWLKVSGKKLKIRGVDLNNLGALVTSSVPLEPGSRVFLYIQSEKLMGWAEVRHCRPRGAFGYRVGLEFRGTLMRTREGNWE